MLSHSPSALQSITFFAKKWRTSPRKNLKSLKILIPSETLTNRPKIKKPQTWPRSWSPISRLWQTTWRLSLPIKTYVNLGAHCWRDSVDVSWGCQLHLAWIFTSENQSWKTEFKSQITKRGNKEINFGGNREGWFQGYN